MLATIILIKGMKWTRMDAVFWYLWVMTISLIFVSPLVTNLDNVLDYFEAILWFTRLGLGSKYLE